MRNWTGNSDHPIEVAKAAYDAYRELPKKGKPQKLKEWTLLSAVIMQYPLEDKDNIDCKHDSFNSILVVFM